MALKIKIDPVERATVATVRADLSLPEQKAAVVQFVREGIAEADQTNRAILGRLPFRTITVDGKQGAPIESVNPQRGSVIVEYELTTDLLRYIADTLVERSPRLSGDYIRGHTLFADGQETKVGQVLPTANVFVFTNFVPYARKIEIGKTKSGRPFVVQVPPRIYERVANDARRRFGNIAKVEFTYQSVRGGLIGSWASTPSARALAARRRRGNPTKHTEWLTRQPAIIVRLLGGLRSDKSITN